MSADALEPYPLPDGLDDMVEDLAAVLLDLAAWQRGPEFQAEVGEALAALAQGNEAATEAVERWWNKVATSGLGAEA